MVKFSQRLSEMRTAKNISAAALAAEIGVLKSQIEKFESGRLTPSKQQQEKLAKYFGVSVMYLNGETDDPEDMAGWLSGNIPDEPASIPVIEKKSPVLVSSGAADKDNAPMFNMLLKSESFKNAVLQVLRTPEGQKVLAQVIQKELHNR